LAAAAQLAAGLPSYGIQGYFVSRDALGALIEEFSSLEPAERALLAELLGRVGVEQVTDANHRYDDPARPVPWQGFTSKGPTVIGDNVWLGANVVVTSGVNIGRRCVIGANSVVTSDLPEFTMAVGAPAKIIATIAR